MHMPREKEAAAQEQPLVRFGLGLANWSERWFPDPLVFALLGIVYAGREIRKPERARGAGARDHSQV